MTRDITESRRRFLKTIPSAGLLFSGVAGCFSGGNVDEDSMKHWDVIVAGGGPGGVSAAVAAARNGARVLLVEHYGFLGGMATSALVLPYMSYKAGDTVITRGLFGEFLDILAENGALLDNRATFDDEPMKWLLDDFVRDAGVDVLLHSRAVGVYRRDATIAACTVLGREGTEDLSADLFIDATGNGDISAWAGAPVEIGRDADNACQPMTLCFRMAGVDVSRMPPSGEINRLYDAAKERGEVTNPREDVLKFYTVHSDVVHFNTTRVVGETALDSWSMTSAEMEGRRQVSDMTAFLKKYVAGFENAYLAKMGSQIGVRESRRIMGGYVLTAEDVLGASHFDDGIACASYMIDIHNPTGTGTEIHHLEEGTYYTIPYRCIVPDNVDNLLVASRCISATHEAHSSLRIMPVVWSIGEAAGVAAAMCLSRGIQPRALDGRELRTALKEQGAYV